MGGKKGGPLKLGSFGTIIKNPSAADKEPKKGLRCF